LSKLASGDLGGCCQCERARCRHAKFVVPIRELKDFGNDRKLGPDMFEPVVMFPPYLREQDFELSLLSPDLLLNPMGPVLQVTANVTHCFVLVSATE